MPERKEIQDLYSETVGLVVAGKLKEALIKLAKLMNGMRVADDTLQFENLDQTYRLMLEYTFRGVPDPQRESVYHSLKVSILELTDKVFQQALANTGMHTAALRRQLEKEKEVAREEAARQFDANTFDYEFSQLLKDTELLTSDGEPSDRLRITPKLFRIIWLSDKYVENDIRIVEAIRTSREIPWYEKSLAVSAVTLSLLNCFDKEKFELLFKFYDDHQEQVWQRALVGLVLALYYYDNRVWLYHSVSSKIKAYAGDEQFVDDLRKVLLQIYKARETEKITKDLQDEILPDVRKFESKLREKLDLDSLLNNELYEDKNPDWEQIFEDSPDLLNKLEKMSEMQMDGLDLFMGTFAMLKHFDFFREISNWFRPFYKENETAIASVGEMNNIKEAFLSSLQSSYYICNSDKYSFCFNIMNLPGEQGDKIMNLFNAEADNFRELMAEDTLLNRSQAQNAVITQYIQDLYRFYKLHPFRSDFRDFFSLNWDISGNILFSLLQKQPAILRKIGEFLFEKEHFNHATGIFQYLTDHEPPEQVILEKLAYSYQRLGYYHKAVENYRKAEFFDGNHLWNMRKIIYCYRRLQEYEEALDWCREASKLDPDDAYIQTMMGNCYLDLKQYDKALEHYFKVEFLAPDNKKVMRPLAWCCFVLNKCEIARNYYQDLLDSDPRAEDYIHAAHVEFCLGNRMKAIELYKSAIHKAGIPLEELCRAIRNDLRYLVANGADESEVNLVTDYLRYL